MIRTQRTGRLARAVAVVAGLSLVAAACGGDDDDEGTAADESTAEATADESTAEATAEESGDEATAEESGEDSMAEEDASSDEPFMVAVVAPSTITDLSWTQALGDGLKAIEESQNLELAFSESLFIVEDAGAALRDYAEQGYDLIIAHGTQYAGSIQELAPEFPETSFAYGTSTDFFGMDNVYAYTAEAEEGGYVNGLMASALTDQLIGVVGPVEAGDAKLYVDGFLAGVAEGGGNASATYTGSFSDVALASEAAQAFIANDVGAMTGTSQSVVGAVGVAQENGVPFFATQSNQTQLAPDIVVANHVYHFEVIFDEIISNIKGGTYGGEYYALNYANGGFVLEFNDGFELDPAIKAIGEDAVAQITSGELDPPGGAEG